MSCLNNCSGCQHKPNRDGGWCYMFRTEPNGLCRQYRSDTYGSGPNILSARLAALLSAPIVVHENQELF